MDAIDTILTRRSIRHFSPQPVPDEDIQVLLKAAMFAPSAGNAQPWHFILINERAVLDQVPNFHTSASFIKETPLAILICADEDLAKPGRWIQDCSAAAENLLLAAHAGGLGACWIGIQPVPERIEGITRLVNLPDKIQPVCLIAVGYPLTCKGYPAETRPHPERFRPERIHHNRW
ncbi:MAG: nitroreductase family protein [Chloroflexi bacterium]|nr:nitroreductase family protein [Chloroflexota bacterium]